MQEAEQHILPADAGGGDATLVTPRFDEAEAQTAQAVVPLAAVRRQQRVWPLLLLAALLGGFVSVGALYLYQRPRTQAVAAPPTIVPEPTTNATPPETAQSAPVADDARPQTNVDERTNAVVPNEPAAAQPKSAAHAPTGQERAAVTRRAEKKEAKAQTARVAVEPRPQRAAANEARGTEVGARRNAEANRRPRAEQTRDAQPQHQTRNVDRIRDIFEGARPPQ